MASICLGLLHGAHSCLDYFKKSFRVSSFSKRVQLQMGTTTWPCSLGCMQYEPQMRYGCSFSHTEEAVVASMGRHPPSVMRFTLTAMMEQGSKLIPCDILSCHVCQ
jgi:hypothetical protein